MRVRDLGPDDIPDMLVLNNAAVPAVNGLDETSLAHLLELSDRVWVASDGSGVGAFLVTMATGVAYESLNYRWLSERYDEFGYVDRIVVSPAHRRLGLAGLLYDTFAEYTSSQGVSRLFCEVNVEPPNPVSIDFHLSAGWRPIDDLTHGPGKVVRFFERPL
ncbi:MAG: GNAT family N-acetyltransferase [Acidimicrobiales bacterium]